MRLENSIAIVTGAGSGIGYGFVRELVRAGCRVAASDKDEEKVRALSRELAGHESSLVTHTLDVSNEAAVRSVFADILGRFGPADILVNNAGVLRDGLLVQPESEGVARKLPTAQWRTVLETNLTGPFLMGREFAASRLESGCGGGLIVNISSLTSTGNPGQSNYAAAKAGLDALTRTWALELAPYGTRVVGIAPGLTDTPMAARLDEAARQAMIEQIPARRMASVHEIWLGLRFAIECDYFNGRVLAIDGGAVFGGG
jgi:3-oxoacyl-[acyl-carrier protein] reductase